MVEVMVTVFRSFLGAFFFRYMGWTFMFIFGCVYIIKF